MTSTPPLQLTVQTPSTPLHGAKYDSYQPYVTRKSTRSSTQRAARTPSPAPLELPFQARKSSRPKKTSVVLSAAHPYSPPSSTQTSPQKKVQPKARRLSGKLYSSASEHEMPIAQPSENLKSSGDTLHAYSTSTLNTTMLPTPAKTPRKKTVQPGLHPAARVLFPTRPENIDDAMPTPRKNGRRKKHIGFSLDSFGADDDVSDEKIEIYTDSKDKVPEVDETEDNPFYVKPGQDATSNGDAVSRNSKRRKINGGVNVNKEIEESFKREDGMVYVFRGKKMFRKFQDEDEDLRGSDGGFVSGTWNDAELEVNLSPRLRPFTRSSIKPRLLFPTEEQRRARQAALDNPDEEAITDIEEPHALDSEMTDIAPETEEETLVTPVKPTFSPASPPTTGRTTRAATRKAALDSSPLVGPEPVEVPRFAVKKGKKTSPFDGWQRTKSGGGGGGKGTSTGKGKKREGEAMERDMDGGKKAKTNGF